MTPSEQKESFPSGPQALWLLLALFMTEYVVGAALKEAQGWMDLGPMAMNTLVVLLANGLVLSSVMHYANLGYRDVLHPSPSSATATLLLLLPPVLMVVPVLVLAMGLLQSLLVALFPLSDWEKAWFDSVMSEGLASVVAVCLLAPMVEEMLFRGIILRGFLKRYPRWQAIGGSAVLFGVAHLNIYQFCIAFVLGLLCGWLYERSRSLLPSIALHASYNGALTWLYMAYGADADDTPGPILLWLAALVLGALGLYWMRRCLAGPRRPLG